LQVTTYLADLSATDYPRFRKLDPSLPEAYGDWVQTIGQQVRTLRARGANVVLYPITFDDFELTMNTLRTGSFDAAARDHYAADKAAADRNAGRL
jgi:hypothetical protein